jgi:hypothetical protein
MNVDGRIEALTHSVELLASMQTHAAETYEEHFLRYDERLLELAELHDREIGEIRRELVRAIRLSVQETHNERKRRQEMAADAAKRHQELEILLKTFLERWGNGSTEERVD